MYKLFMHNLCSSFYNLHLEGLRLLPVPMTTLNLITLIASQGTELCRKEGGLLRGVSLSPTHSS